MQLTIQIISYCRLDARADRIFRGALKKFTSCDQRRPSEKFMVARRQRPAGAGGAVPVGAKPPPRLSSSQPHSEVVVKDPRGGGGS